METSTDKRNYFGQFQPGRSFTYSELQALITAHVANNTTTGVAFTTTRIQATKLNLQRMKRLSKTTQLLPVWDQLGPNTGEGLYWVVLVEAWCGDVAQTIPILQCIAEKLHIRMDFILRDENLDIMGKYLFRETRSIPRLICFNRTNCVELGIWGPRPKEAQAIVDHAILNKMPHDDWAIIVQNWYNENKTVSLQNELFSFVRNCLN